MENKANVSGEGRTGFESPTYLSFDDDRQEDTPPAQREGTVTPALTMTVLAHTEPKVREVADPQGKLVSVSPHDQPRQGSIPVAPDVKREWKEFVTATGNAPQLPAERVSQKTRSNTTTTRGRSGKNISRGRGANTQASTHKDTVKTLVVPPSTTNPLSVKKESVLTDSADSNADVRSSTSEKRREKQKVSPPARVTWEDISNQFRNKEHSLYTSKWLLTLEQPVVDYFRQYIPKQGKPMFVDATLSPTTKRNLWYGMVLRRTRFRNVVVNPEIPKTFCKSLHLHNWEYGKDIDGVSPAKLAYQQAYLKAFNSSAKILRSLIGDYTDQGLIVDMYGTWKGGDNYDIWSDYATAVLYPEECIGYDPQFFLPPIWYEAYRPIRTRDQAAEFYRAPTNYKSTENFSFDKLKVPLFFDLPFSVAQICTTFLETKCQKAVVVTSVFGFGEVAGSLSLNGGYFILNGLVYVQDDVNTGSIIVRPLNSEWQTQSEMEIPGHRQCVVWSESRAIGNYHIYILSSVDARYLTSHKRPENRFQVIPQQALVVTKRIEPKTLIERAKAAIHVSIYNRDLQVFFPAVEQLCLIPTGGNRPSFEQSTLRRSIEAIINDKKYIDFWRIAGNSYPKTEVATDTLAYILWASMHHDIDVYTEMANQFGSQTAILKSCRNSQFSEVPRIDWKRLFHQYKGYAALSLFFLLYINRKRFVKVAAFLTRVFPTGFSLKTIFDRIITFLKNWFIKGKIEVKDATSEIVEVAKQARESAKFITSKNVLTAEEMKSFVERPADNLGHSIVRGVMSVPYFLASLYFEEALKFKLPLIGSVGIAVVESCFSAQPWWFKALSLPIRGLVHYGFAISPNPLIAHATVNAFIALGNIMDGRWKSQQGSGYIGLLLASAGAISFETVRLVSAGRGFSLYDAWTEYKQNYDELNHCFEPPASTIPVPIEQARLLSCTNDPDLRDGLHEQRTDVFLFTAPWCQMVRPYGPGMFSIAYNARNLCASLITETCEGERPCGLETTNFQHGKVTKCPVARYWYQSAKVVSDLIMNCYDWSRDGKRKTRAEYIAHFKELKKRIRAQNAYNDRADTGLIRAKADIFLKGDEVLAPRLTFPPIKPRSIKAVHPTVQVHCGVYFDAAFKNLKLVFNEKNPYQVGDWMVTAAIGSGRNASGLNKWLKTSLAWVKLRDKSLAFIVAGDDFFGLAWVDGQFIVLENDFSKYDRTQGVHALGCEYMIARALGIKHSVMLILYAAIVAVATYEDKRTGERYKTPMPTQRATGGPDTTFGNSVNNIVSVFHTLLNGGGLDFPTWQAKLGLEAKLKRHTNISMGTFLKGWWLPTETGQLCWYPLPSQAIKAGKIMTCPTQIFKKLPPTQAWRAAARGMALGFGLVDLDYPLFGAQLKHYLSLSESDFVIPLESHKIFLDVSVRLDRGAVLELIEQRYNITSIEVQQMEEEISSSPFPCVLSHPVWLRLVATDYW